MTAWVIVQVAATTFPLLDLPAFSVKLVLLLAIIGFPVTLVGAWIYDLTAKGLVITPAADAPAQAALIVDAIPPELKRIAPCDCVAVLPFVNLSTDPDNEYFADGITEDVIAQLSKVGALRVISRTSVMNFKKRDRPLREIASALGATTLVEGSVRRAADRVRIVAQLVDSSTEQNLWAETYDRQLTDVFAIQTDVALNIAAALRAKLSPDESSRIRKEPTQSVEAYQLYLQGRHFYVRYTEEAMKLGLEYFQRAIERDPNYAPGHASIAMAYSELGEMGKLKPTEAFPRAQQSVARALGLDSELAEAHCVAGHLKCVYEFDWAGGDRAFKRALELSPSSADTYDLYGRMCSGIGRNEEGIALITRANELDPLAHRSDLATAYLRAGRLDEALGLAQRAVQLEPYYSRARATLGWAHILRGSPSEGVAELEKAVELSPDDATWIAQLGQAYAVTGRLSDARSIEQKLTALAAEQYVSPYHMAYLYTGLGEHDRAIDCLEQAYTARAGAVYGIKASFLFASLRSHPRFVALLARMNLA